MIKHARQETVKIVAHRRVGRGYLRLTFASAKIASAARPGQFVMVDARKAGVPFLRRPLGVHSVEKNKVEVLYEVVGPGTENLSRKKPGESLDIIGPLGNGFDLPAVKRQASAILVAGGMGVAPLLFLARRMAGAPRVLLGAKSREKVLCEREFKEAGCGVAIATDDGSRGFKGKVTDLLARLLSGDGSRASVIYACGPAPMLKMIAGLSKTYRIPAQVSLEAHMSCGFGACLGCVVDTAQGYKRVCKDGPVFSASEIIF